MKRELNSPLQKYPSLLAQSFSELSKKRDLTLYFSGGTVRDWILGKKPADLDIAVSHGAIGCAQWLSKKLHATFVLLSEAEGVARVVWNDISVDFSKFRYGAHTIEQDLLLRDFTINSIAISFTEDGFEKDGDIIDPLDGFTDLQKGIVRHTLKSVFTDDPLRLLRAYRFSASHRFSIDNKTQKLINNFAHLITEPAAERIHYEIDCIFSSDNAGQVFTQMAHTPLFGLIFPEVAAGIGVEQPSSHHLDVASHCLECLCMVDKLIKDPLQYFHCFEHEIIDYLSSSHTKILLRKAAFLHDIGKVPTEAYKGQRITFYKHDTIGSDLIDQIAIRQKWSTIDSRLVGMLVRHHMRPFHLNNAKKKTGITAKACLKLVKAVDKHLIGLFVLAMADSMAGCGAGKPKGMEQDIAHLFDEVYTYYVQQIKPVLRKPLLNGNDLMSTLKLKSGPIIGKLLSELEILRVENPAMEKKDALDWAARILKNEKQFDPHSLHKLSK